jgi:orotate phosphoribosyltransferase
MKEALRLLLKEHAYRYREAPFKLKSGIESNHYVDCRPVIMHPFGAKLAGELLSDVIYELIPKVDIIAGVVLGAVPLVDEVVTRDFALQGAARGKAYVRPGAKGHGTQSLVELDFMSRLQQAVRPLTAVLLEDVWTTGGSARKAKETLKNEGIEVLGTIALVDRSEPGSLAPDHSIFRLSDLLR